MRNPWNGVTRRFLLAWRSAQIRRQGIDLISAKTLGPSLQMRRGWNAHGTPGSISLADNIEIERGTILDAAGGRIEIQHDTYVGPYTILYGHGGLTVGSYTLIGPHCCLLSSNHTVPPAGHLIRFEADELLPTVIGCDVWIGAHVTVLGGVTIGDGCVIGAGTVVTHNLPPLSIAYGVPAQIHGTRVSK